LAEIGRFYGSFNLFVKAGTLIKPVFVWLFCLKAALAATRIRRDHYTDPAKEGAA
jgi:hypothetical protein